MESAAIAAKAFGSACHTGTLLCVSDKPLHGEIKLAGVAGEFYSQRVGQHLEIELRALEKRKAQDWERLHPRKLGGGCGAGRLLQKLRRGRVPIISATPLPHERASCGESDLRPFQV
jgi:hypothetical protein